MKKLPKAMLATGGALLLGAGAVASYLMAQPEQQMSDLTLANLEAMAINPDDKDFQPIQAQGPSHESKNICPRCQTYHVICEGKPNGGICQNIHCLL